MLWGHFYQMRDLFVAFVMVVTPERGCMTAFLQLFVNAGFGGSHNQSELSEITA
jgi:hypothetical protein